MTESELIKILKLHQKWLNGEPDGKKGELEFIRIHDTSILYKENLSKIDMFYVKLERVFMNKVDLSHARLFGSNFSGIDMCQSNLQYAKLNNVNLRNAFLFRSNFHGANLTYSNLSGANLGGADLSYADLRGADLRNTYLVGATLDNIITDEDTKGLKLHCPETGSFIGYKKVSGFCYHELPYDVIIKLEIPEDARRSSATSNKCRCSKAKVLSITTLDGSDADINKVYNSKHDGMMYEVGKVSEVKDFDTDRWRECSTGIHFFMTREEAVKYIV